MNEQEKYYPCFLNAWIYREGCSIGILHFILLYNYTLYNFYTKGMNIIQFNLDYVYIYKTLYILKLASIICIISVSMLSILYSAIVP